MKIKELLNEDGSPKSINGFEPLYSYFDDTWFLNSWISNCRNYFIQDDLEGNIRLVPANEETQFKWFQKYSIVEGDLDYLLSIYEKETTSEN